MDNNSPLLLLMGPIITHYRPTQLGESVNNDFNSLQCFMYRFLNVYEFARGRCVGQTGPCR